MNKSLPMENGSSIKGIYPSAYDVSLQRPLFLSGVSAGFPSPADDYLDRKLDEFVKSLSVANRAQ